MINYEIIQDYDDITRHLFAVNLIKSFYCILMVIKVVLIFYENSNVQIFVINSIIIVFLYYLLC